MKKNIFKRALIIIIAALSLCWLCGCFESEPTGLRDQLEKKESELSSRRTERKNGSDNQSGSFEGAADKVKNDTSKAESVTVLCYMNGSNLESQYGEATTDISEMVAAKKNDKVKIVLQTMGTKKWKKKYGVSSKESQRFEVTDTGLELVMDGLGQLDCTRSSTLSDFIKWGAKTYPADRYILLFWDHGGGPVYGFGYDEFQSENDSMTIDEIQLALGDAGVKFDFIGMDCCIMSCMEVCCACYDFCDYMLLSEDFESGLGWSYKGWLSELAKNPSIDTISLAKRIIDDTVSANEQNFTDGDSTILSLVDESVMKVLYSAWKSFAIANEEALIDQNYSRKCSRSNAGRISKRLEGKVSLSEYYITDIMAVAQNIDSEESKALASAVSNAIAYMNCTESDSHLTGIAVSLPYGDNSYYSMQKAIFKKCGFDDEYVTWLEKFTTADNSFMYDYSIWDDIWDGWDSYEDDYDWTDWDNWDDDDYWSEDGSCGFADWDLSDFWDDDWSDFDFFDYFSDYDDYDYDSDDSGYVDDFDYGDDWFYGDYDYDDYYDDYYDGYYDDDWYDDDWYDDDWYDDDWYDDDDWYNDDWYSEDEEYGYDYGWN